MIFKSFDIFQEVVESYESKRNLNWRVSDSRLREFEFICSEIDKMAKGISVRGVTFGVEDDTFDIVIELEAQCLTIEGDEYGIALCSPKAKKLSFILEDENTVIVKYVFDSVWDIA